MQTEFVSLPIIDGHVHFVHPERMKEMLALMDAVPCQRFNLVCIPNPDGSTHNPAALFFKQHHPGRAFISGALDYSSALAVPSRASMDLARQVTMLRSKGFDGLKLIEGKPQVRKLLPYPLDGELYESMWAVLEEEQFPVIFHVNDPDEFWDVQGCPGWARQSGWDYSDGSFPSREELYQEVDHILGRHPNLNIIFAHFYFLSRELERAGTFLDTHPRVSFDLAPHLDMFSDLSLASDAARSFFLRYQDRIIYGTDTDTRTIARGPEGLQFIKSLPTLIRSFLELDGPFNSANGNQYCGLGLPVHVLEKIYATNFERVYGQHPKPLKL